MILTEPRISQQIIDASECFVKHILAGLSMVKVTFVAQLWSDLIAPTIIIESHPPGKLGQAQAFC
jgi:hypothetical protein